MELTNESAPWYVVHNVNKLDSPCLVVYLDRVKANIKLVKAMAGNVQRLRPHVKTHKTKEAAVLLLEAGMTKFKCATIAEAEMLAQIKAPDVLLAYQPVGPKAERYLALLKQYPQTKFSCLVDIAFAAKQLSGMAVQHNRSLDVYIDLNVGMNRTGTTPDKKAVALYQLCAELPGINPAGLHVYDGHIVDSDFHVRTEKCNAAFAPVEQLKGMLVANGFQEPVIIAGGSATFPIHLKQDGVECSPGTFIFWDAGYSQLLPEQPFQPAALVVTRIISLPDERTICTDLGHKSVASENVLSRRVLFLNAPELTVIGHSEEHLVLKAEATHNYKIGDVLYGLPFHICPTCALYDHAVVIEDNEAKTEWKIVARDRKLTV